MSATPPNNSQPPGQQPTARQGYGPLPATPTLAKSAKKPFFRRTWVLVVAAGLVGLAAGVAAAIGPDVKTTPEYIALASQLAASQSDLSDSQDELTVKDADLDDTQADLTLAQSDLTEAQADLSDAQADVRTAQSDLKTVEGDIPRRERAVKTTESDLDARDAALGEAERSVTKREEAVGIVETQVKSNTVSGEGMYKVGADIDAGTYRTQGARGCYYAVLNSTDTFDIAVNGNVNGPAFATVRAGQYLELSGCADWVLQS